MTGTLDWAGDITTSKFCSTFDYNWGTGTLFSYGGTDYADYVGFQAKMQINKQRDGPVTFTVGADDSVRLYIDGSLVIDDWTPHGYRTQTIIINNMTQGLHSLELYYREQTAWARVSFSCDSDLLMWRG